VRRNAANDEMRSFGCFVEKRSGGRGFEWLHTMALF
jgi:hypothetical protein